MAGVLIAALTSCSEESVPGEKGEGRVEDYERARKAAREAQAQRSRDRDALLNDPEIRTEWISLAHDRSIGVRREQRQFELIDGGERSFRGMRPQTIINRNTGTRLEIGSGDTADKYTDAMLTLGGSGQRFRFNMYWDRDPAGYTIVSIGGAPVYNFSHWDDKNRWEDVAYLHQKVAELLSWEDPRFAFGGQIGPKFVVDQRKHQYYGERGIEQYRRDLADFLDHYVDELYASRGINPAQGRRNPYLIGNPNARRPL